MSQAYPVRIELLLASRRHRYEGRPADGALPLEPGVNELPERIEIRAGKGIVGDRYFGHAAHVDAAVTLIAAESLDAVSASLGVPIDPVRTRRNVVLRGADVDALRGVEFSLDSGHGPVLLRGTRPANPCAWMDRELAPGAFAAMRRRGGMRCVPLSDGVLTLGDAQLRTIV